MEVQRILNSSYLDILFDGRNKRYGGYELRKNYTRRLAKGVVGLFCMAVIVAGCSFMSKGEELKGDVLVFHGPTTLSPPPLDPVNPTPPPPPPPPPPARVQPTEAFIPPEITEDHNVPDEDLMPTQDDLHDVNIGAADTDGDPYGIEPNIITAGGNGSEINDIVEPPKDKKWIYVEQMPEPLYNVNAYLSKNLVYPKAAIDNNIEGTLHVQFVVEIDGSITDVTIVRKRVNGGGLEQEALRVVNSMPKRKPGRQNGKAVRVLYTLPIKFDLD